jgi:hypothetical protein
VGADSARIASFAEELGTVADRGGLADIDIGIAYYNIACFHALAGRLDQARPFLRRAFRLSPDLVDFSREDSDLTALWGELDELARPTPG